MAYYPKSQIKTNLYTDGTEYETSNGTPYMGFYFKTSTGELYTGRTPQDLPNLELFPLITNENTPITGPNTLNQYQVKGALEKGDIDPEINPDLLGNVYIYSEYTNLTGTPPTTSLPYYSPETPTNEDYSIGEFRRYFCKKTNEIKYIEINKTQYDLLTQKSSKILWSLYQPFYLNWDIAGDKQQAAQTNKNIVELTSVKKKLPKLGDYLRHDYLKYYK